MNGTKFELDEQKASKLSGMSVSEVWDFINQKAKEADLIVVKNGEYQAKGSFYISSTKMSEAKVEFIVENAKVKKATKKKAAAKTEAKAEDAYRSGCRCPRWW